ncbi:MAG TPA: MBL fold metallo-hydrolase [Aggregatilineales bacterium]|nr:MBL fold metallo-hydrolase [Aggregatilineales bacterium]
MAPGQVALWWLGQSGYAIKTASILFYIDLYLSEHLTTKYAATEKPHIRMTEAPLRGGDITDAAWLFASHKHSDHLDPGTAPAFMRASPGAQLILPGALIDYAAGLGLARERLIGTRGDETFTVGPMTVHSIPSSHPGLDYDAATGYPFLGYVFEIDGVRLYHSGDTLVYPGLAERLRRFDPDLLFLPINGTDTRREALQVPPNMNSAEAVALAKAVGARLTIPHHYDMFTFNTADVSEFTAQASAADIPYSVLHAGERFVWCPPR